MYHYKTIGLDNIFLKNGFDEIETDYGVAVSIHNLDGLHRVIGLEISLNKRELSGNEFRFLRKELGLSQVQIAKTLGISESTVRNWENDRVEKISASPAAIVKQMFIESVGNNSTLTELLDSICALNNEIHHLTVELEEHKNGWLVTDRIVA
jgi:DNA-binding transcriptional regulator YiaG